MATAPSGVVTGRMLRSPRVRVRLADRSILVRSGDPHSLCGGMSRETPLARLLTTHSGRGPGPANLAATSTHDELTAPPPISPMRWRIAAPETVRCVDGKSSAMRCRMASSPPVAGPGCQSDRGRRRKRHRWVEAAGPPHRPRGKQETRSTGESYFRVPRANQLV